MVVVPVRCHELLARSFSGLAPVSPFSLFRYPLLQTKIWPDMKCCQLGCQSFKGISHQGGQTKILLYSFCTEILDASRQTDTFEFAFTSVTDCTIWMLHRFLCIFPKTAYRARVQLVKCFCCETSFYMDTHKKNELCISVNSARKFLFQSC